MLKELFNKNKTDYKTEEKLYNYLANFTDDEKCVMVEDTAKDLISHNDEADYDMAERILIHATQFYFDVSSTDYKALIYYRLGEFYENIRKDYIKAYTYYQKHALNNTKNDGTHSIIMRILLLRDDFSYSEELEKELKLSYGEIDLGLRNDRIYENIAALIVARHKNTDEKLCEKLVKRIKSIVKTHDLLPLDFFTKKDTVKDVITVPQKVFDFIEKL